MEPYLETLIHTAGIMALWLCGFFVAFSVLARVFPCNPGQPLWRKDTLTDLAYCFIMPVFNRIVRILFIGAGIFFLFRGDSTGTINEYLATGYGPLAQMPIWLQAAVIVLLSDVVLYWTHRWFHGRSMWRFHAIHHSSKQIDWLSTFRFHPVNTWLSFTLLDALILLAGFSPEAVAAMSAVNMIYSAMVHANLNWTFGPFRYLFASPVFHRWHHTTQAEGLDKNFAPTFPLLDIMFGTFYMPEGQRPEHFGITGSTMEGGFLKQIVWPFRGR